MIRERTRAGLEAARENGRIGGRPRKLNAHQREIVMELVILVQVAALKQAVNGVGVELLQAHMESCVLPQVEAGASEGKEALESLKGALSKVLKHG